MLTTADVLPMQIVAHLLGAAAMIGHYSHHSDNGFLRESILEDP